MNQITALRGLAIIFIVLFHLWPQGMPYGYFGVEVFLVISGFLLMRSLQKQGMQLRLGEFAGKKVMRLFVPVAVLVPLTLLAALWFQDYAEVGRASVTGAHTLVGNANRFLDRLQSDYFAPDSAGNPFLHMWYLAVTVQVYLLFAAACVLARYLPRRAMLCLLWVVGLGSFFWAYSWPLHQWLQSLGVPTWEQARPVSHYMTLPRLWEPMAGAWLSSIHCITPPDNFGALTRRSWGRAALFLLGLLCIILPSLAHGEAAALCPAFVVAGTCLVIRYGDAGLTARAFNNTLLLWLGTISFSLYLVHMPLIAFYHSWFLQAPDAWGMGCIGLLSLGMGYLFYRWVETRRVGWRVFLPLYLAALGFCVVVRCMDGFKDYIHVEANRIELPTQANAAEIRDESLYTGYDREAIPYSSNIFAFVDQHSFRGAATPRLLHAGDASQPPSFVLLGDSHAAAAFPGLNTICKEMGLSGAYMTSVIMPFWDWDLPPLSFEKSYYCDEAKVRALLAWLKAHPELRQVVISQYWGMRYRSTSRRDWKLQSVPNTAESYGKALEEFVAAIQALDKEVVLLAPFLQIGEKDVLKRIRTARRRGLAPEQAAELKCSREEYLEANGEVYELLKAVAAKRGCTLVQMLDYIDKDEPFCAYEHGNILYKDRDHMTSEGSDRLFRHLRPQLEACLRRPVSPHGCRMDAAAHGG